MTKQDHTKAIAIGLIVIAIGLLGVAGYMIASDKTGALWVALGAVFVSLSSTFIISTQKKKDLED